MTNNLENGCIVTIGLRPTGPAFVFSGITTQQRSIR
jgi:hypothetical protein